MCQTRLTLVVEVPVTTSGDDTAFVQCKKICLRAVGSPNKKKLPVTACTQRSYNVSTAFSQRPYSVHDVLTAGKTLLQRAHGALTARIHRSLGRS